VDIDGLHPLSPSQGAQFIPKVNAGIELNSPTTQSPPAKTTMRYDEPNNRAEKEMAQCAKFTELNPTKMD